MESEIQKLLNEVEEEKSKASQKAKGFYNMKSTENGMWNDGSISAFDFVIERLKKILNERNSVDEGEKSCDSSFTDHIWITHGRSKKCKICGVERLA